MFSSGFFLNPLRKNFETNPPNFNLSREREKERRCQEIFSLWWESIIILHAVTVFLLYSQKANRLVRETQRHTLGQHSPLLAENVVSVHSPWLIPSISIPLFLPLPCCQVITYTDLLGRWNSPETEWAPLAWGSPWERLVQIQHCTHS